MADFSYQGGIVIPNPYPVKKVGLVQAPLPDKVVLPLQQRIGEQAQPCVKVGERVLTGQVIAVTDDAFCVPIHASISGTVVAIDQQKVPHKSGLKSSCITIESDGKDEWIEHQGCGVDFLNCKPSTMVDYIQQSGIVGLGGAGFPTHTKLRRAKECHTLIVNGTECEPGVMCDDALMQNYPKQIIHGIEILLHICGAKRAIIAVEDDKKEAYKTLLECNNNEKISIQKIPYKYTSGAEKLLIKALLGIEIPSGGYAPEVGVVCQNVATVKAIFDAVIDNRPLVSRLVTVTGSAIKEPMNYEVRLGASFEHIVSLSQYKQDTYTVRMGGMMMGIDVDDLSAPICKITNAIFVNQPDKQPVVKECIRCSNCNTVCPVGLLPQQLYWFAKSENIKKAEQYHLSDCIECACCNYVCPSHIPLADYFAFAKALKRQQNTDEFKTNRARDRFEYREYRLERNKKERAEMMAEKKRALKEKMAKDKAQKAKIDAAIKRVGQAKKDKSDAG